MSHLTRSEVFEGMPDLDMKYTIYTVAQELQKKHVLPPVIWVSFQMYFGDMLDKDEVSELNDSIKDTHYHFENGNVYYYGMKLEVGAVKR